MGCGHLNAKQVLILLLIGSRSKKCIVLLGDLVCIVQTQMAVTLLHNVVYGATVVHVHTCAIDERHGVIGTRLCVLLKLLTAIVHTLTHHVHFPYFLSLLF